MVGAAELPVENTLVFTACLGITGAELIGSSFLLSMLTVGAGSSSTLAEPSVVGPEAARR